MLPEELLEKGKSIMTKKRHDYVSQPDVNIHENFERSAEIASWFKSDIDKSYTVLIGTKLARLASLLDSKEPNNESVEDSFLDLMNYVALWGSKRIVTVKPEASQLETIKEKAIKCLWCGKVSHVIINDNFCSIDCSSKYPILYK